MSADDLSRSDSFASATAPSVSFLNVESETKTRQVKFSHRWVIENYAFYCYDKKANDSAFDDGTETDGSEESSDSEEEDDIMVDPRPAIHEPNQANDQGGGDGGAAGNENVLEIGLINGRPHQRCLHSGTFASPVDEELKFFIELYPNGSREKYKNFTSIFLNFQPSPTHQRIMLGFQFFLLGEKDQVRYSDEFDRCLFDTNNKIWGSYSFVPSEFLLDPKNGLLHDGSLTICCEIAYEEQLESIQVPKKQEVANQSANQLVKDIASLLESKAHSDVVLLLGSEEEKLPANKAILGALSPVFATMFECEMEEKAKGRVWLKDTLSFAEDGALRLVLMDALMQYMYADMVDPLLMKKYDRELLWLADQFQMDQLKLDCQMSLLDKLTNETAFEYLLLADKHDASTLKLNAIQLLRSQIIGSESNSDDMRMLLEKQPKLFCEMFTSLADEGSTPERFINIGAHPQMKRIVSDLESERPFDSFTFTGSRVVRCAHQWVIDAISSYDKNYYYYHFIGSTDAAVHTAIESSAFFSPLDDQVQFCLKLYPNGERSSSRNYISLYLRLKAAPANRRIAVQAKVSFLNASGKVTHSKVIRKELGPDESQCGWPFFLYSDLLKRDKAGLFVNDGKLVLRCEVAYINAKGDCAQFFARGDNLNRMSAKLNALLGSEKLSDITIVVAGKEFRAHKCILASRSAVFASMLANCTGPEDRLETDDQESEVFAELLAFVYTAKTDKLEEWAEKLLPLARKYQVDSLLAQCEVALCAKVSVETVSKLVLLAQSTGATKLKMKAIEFINAHLASLLKNDCLKTIINEDPNLFAEIFYI